MIVTMRPSGGIRPPDTKSLPHSRSARGINDADSVLFPAISSNQILGQSQSVMRDESRSRTVHISGDTLALDKAVRDRVEGEAAALQQRHPDVELELRVRIAEELDQIHGHRVRCELVATAGNRRQVVVREAQKDAMAAIAGAFGSAKRQLRRLAHRGPPAADGDQPGLRAGNL